LWRASRQVDEAFTLANECLKLPMKRPRAYRIAGFCELERAIARPRSRPEFAEDLRAAQPVLLILHFS